MTTIIEQPVAPRGHPVAAVAPKAGNPWTFNYLIGAILTAPFVPPVAALFGILFVLALISDRQFEERIETLEQATEPDEQAAAVGAVVSNGCSWLVILAVVSVAGAFLLLAAEVGR